MKPPVLLVSDIHFHAYKAHSTLVDGMNSRFLHQMEAWRRAVDVGLAHGCELMLIAGDVFEVRGNIRPSIFNRVTDLMMETLRRGLQMGVVPGNHDMEHLEAGESAVDSWDYLEIADNSTSRGITVFKAPKLELLAGYRVLGIPYIHDLELFRETYRRLSAETSPDITVIHQGIDDFISGGGYPLTGLTAQWLEEHNPGTIVCGHYHKPGCSGTGRVINVGALMQHRFNDEGSERGCWILRDGSARFTGIESPRFLTVKGSGRIGAECSGAIVRIRAASAGEAEELRRKVEDAGPLSVVVELEREFKTAHERVISITSPRGMLAEYLELVDKYRDHRDEIMNLFDGVCMK